METTEYIAHAFNDGLPNGRAGGTLTVSEAGLTFRVQGQTITLPLKELKLQLGGARNRLVFCTHPRFSQWQFYCADMKFLDAPALQGHPAVLAIRSARWRHFNFQWGSVLGALALIALVGGLIYWSLDGVSAMAARQVPAAWEEKLGESVLDQYRLQHDFMDEKAAAALLQPLTEPLVKALPGKRAMRFYIVQDASINAFALPGGYMVINTGLILAAQRAEALQGVLGHEMGHVTEQHGLRAVIRSAGVYVLLQALVGDASGLLSVLADAGPLLLNQTYSRDFEREADAKGYALMKQAKVNPRGMIDFFRIVLAEEKKQLAKISNKDARDLIDRSKGFLSTHPETEERIASLEKKLLVEKSAVWRDDQPQFSTLKQAVQQFVIQQKGSAQQ